MTNSLSIPQARKLILLSQRLPSAKKSGSALAATLSAIEHLGYIQIDTLSVVPRAHHHTLWNRNARYKAKQLDKLVADKMEFEYWSHGAAYLPMRDYRFSLIRKQALKSGEKKHWYKRDDKMIRQVLERIKAEGPLMARDFEHSGKKVGEWGAKPAKQALEYLFMQGDLMIASRVNFQKVYDFPERVLPEGINTTLPSPEEYARYLIIGFLCANGLGQPSEMAYLLTNTKQLVATTVAHMLEAGELQQISVSGNTYYALPESLQLLSKPLSRSKLKILSPFDNLLIQRKRMQALFDFDYQIECYVPQAKRKYGYFSLPILWDGKLVARMDCKADRKMGTLHILYLAVEPRVKKVDAFVLALRKEMKVFLEFNNCNQVILHRVSPDKLKSDISSGLSDLYVP